MFKALSIALLVSCFLLVLGVMMERKAHLTKAQELQTCRVEKDYLSVQLTDLTEKHNTLKKLCEIDKQKIESQYKTILQKAMQKPKTIEIPVIVEKPVYIASEDCQRLGVMIDEAVSILNNSK